MQPEALLDLTTWIAEASLQGIEESELVSGLGTRANATGLPLWRISVGLDTLHPVIGGVMSVWRRNTGVAERREYGRSDDINGGEAWQRSPYFRLIQTGERRLRLRLDGDLVPGEMPVLGELKAQGATDYAAYVCRLGAQSTFGDMDCVYSSWTSDAPEGFDEQALWAIDRLVPALSIAVQSASLARMARSLAAIYLGADAGARVLKGSVGRGVTDRISAVLWFSDLQGFTKIADRSAPEQLIPFLNDYAECLVAAIHHAGGQVLKFIGDGILATFAIDTASAAAARAIAAVDTARAGLAEVNQRRSEAGLPVTSVDIALHIGEVLYGNIGSVDRLDFTVVGPVVNELARIEAMCGSLDQQVVTSAAFAAAAGKGDKSGGGERLVSLGRYALRGVGKPQELFTLLPVE